MRRGGNWIGARRRRIFSRLLKYAEDKYGVRRALERVGDRREVPRIETMRVVTGLFHMVCLRLGSLNAIEQVWGKVKRRTLWNVWMGGDLPSADRLGEVAALLELDDLRDALFDHHRRRKRKKTLSPLAGGLRVLILDGHEVGASYRRHCKDCLTREIKHDDETRIQYYHRYVMACLLCEDARVLLDIEVLRKGEGEIAAATRLVKRLLEKVPRAFNVVAGDALYLDPKLCEVILNHNKDFIAVLKKESRELIKDFRGLVELLDEDPAVFMHNRKKCRCRDIEGFTSWTQLDHEIRVVQSVETATVRRQRNKEQETSVTEWLWATSLSKQQANTRTVVRIGHGRWDIENQGFNELVNQWHADHIYHHDTNAIIAILLLLFLAYNLFHVWVSRALKPQLREKHTAMYFAKLITAEFYYTLLHPT